MGGEYLLEDIPPDVKKTAKKGWRCSEGHIFSKSFVLVNNNKWCVKCSNIRTGIEKYQELAIKNGGEYILDKVPHQCCVNVEQGWKCKNGHIFDGRYSYFILGNWCHQCLIMENAKARSKCNYILKSGSQKGERCFREAITDGYCGSHYTYLKNREQLEKEEKKSELKEPKKMQIIKILQELKIENKNLKEKIERLEREKELDVESDQKQVISVDTSCQTEEHVEPEQKQDSQIIPLKQDESLNMILQFDQREIRIVGTHDQPWFVAKDIAEILGYGDTNQAIRKHVDDEDKKLFGFDRRDSTGSISEKAILINESGFDPVVSTGSISEKAILINESGFHPAKTAGSISEKAILINESGLYSLILKSKLPTAKTFKRWVTSEVLPSLRKTGSYHNSPDMQRQFDTLNQIIKTEQNKYLQLETEYNELKIEAQSTIKNLRYQVKKHAKHHTYYKLGVDGPCFYLMEFSACRLKPGIAGMSNKKSDGDKLDDRLRQHRTDEPDAILHCVVSGSKAFIQKLEQIIQFRYQESLIASNHEVIENIPVEELIEIINCTLPCLATKDKWHLIHPDEIKKYNDSVNETTHLRR